MGANILLDNEQAIELAVFGYIYLNGHTLFKRKRFDTVLQAKDELQQGDQIAQTRTACFILNRNQNSAPVVQPTLNHFM